MGEWLGGVLHKNTAYNLLKPMYAPIAWFLVFLLTLNWAEVRWIGFPNEA